MSSDPVDGDGTFLNGNAPESVEFLLFDSLVHHLVEKGLLTKNDALSVIQTAAQVVQGRGDTNGNRWVADATSALERTYGSFQALPDRHGRPGLDADNIVPLRPPLHGDRPQFPTDDTD